MDRIQKEKEFHNRRFHEETRDELDKYYAVAPLINNYYDTKLEAVCKGKIVLEYGSGLGSHSFKIAGLASQIHAIDISEVAISKSKEIARNNSIKNISFHVMNAESLDFPDNYFDIICGTSILHHLDLNLAYPEIVRVLKENGKIFFIEPLGHNPIINFFRKKTAHLRTEDEHPFLKKDIDLLDKFFAVKKNKHFCLVSLLAIPFRNRRNFRKILNLLNTIDQVIFKFPFLKFQAWLLVIQASNPKK